MPALLYLPSRLVQAEGVVLNADFSSENVSSCLYRTILLRLACLLLQLIFEFTYWELNCICMNQSYQFSANCLWNTCCLLPRFDAAYIIFFEEESFSFLLVVSMQYILVAVKPEEQKWSSFLCVHKLSYQRLSTQLKCFIKIIQTYKCNYAVAWYFV